MPLSRRGHGSHRVLVFSVPRFHLTDGNIQAEGPTETLEAAIYERMQELVDSSDSHAERLAMRVACEKILEIKINKLGFPAVHSESERCARIG